MNGCAPGLALIERLKATRKWAIDGDDTPIFKTLVYNALYLILYLILFTMVAQLFHYKFKILTRDINMHVYSLEIVSNFINYSAKLFLIVRDWRQISIFLSKWQTNVSVFFLNRCLP